ncbi:Metalloenzyme, LuxS/M16 peptidase-like protein [Geopyxis carbonaria]|nr:Metalloenzyme, LuxS/M16 peptidase-like protein [Geopyxis carbonaria]
MFRGGLSIRSTTIKAPIISRHLIQRKYSGSLAGLPKTGEKLHGFTVQRKKNVPELELAAIQLRHDSTGADYIHISREDKNNVFAIGFKTNPNDDTGVPHILEHTTLCGSKKYPIRDPFFKMLNRSLSNFMNAFTSGDYTSYPFATTNRVDFNNLMDVYLDATLEPLLQENDFKQEGWRIGPENPTDPASSLLFKGVVYNEMKGQMSDSSYLYYIKFQKHIFPDLHNSGGDPEIITDLTIDQLRNFHREHYNASNARIFTYGDIPISEHLARLNEKLQGRGVSNTDQDLRLPTPLSENKNVIVKGPIDPLMDKEAQHKTSISWIMNDTTDVVETFGLRILSTYLLDGYGSPLYQGLIDEKLGSDFSPNTGFDTSSPKGIFSVGLQNVRPEDLTKVQEKIPEILANVHKNGFDRKKIDGILHQLELALKHKTANFGLSVMQDLMPSWFNGVDPFDALAWEETVSKFRQRYSEGNYLESLMEKYLLHSNTFTFTMVPDKDYERNLGEQEALRLSTELEKAGGESKARESLVAQELNLLDIQERARNEDLSCLPTLKVDDIPRVVDKNILEQGSIEDVSVQWRIAPTNGLTYFRAVNSLKDLPEDLRMFLPLFTDAILRLGTHKKSMEQLEDEIKLKTGGIRAGTHVTTDPFNLEISEEGLVYSGYCLDKNVPDMLQLLQNVLLDTNFSAVSKLRTLVHGTASGFVNTLAESGHGFARTFASAHLTPAARANEVMGGMTQVRLISNLAAQEIYNTALEKLKEISKFAARRNGLRIALTCGSSAVADNERAVRNFIQGLPVAKSPIRDSPLFDFETPSKSFFPLPYQVSYAAMCVKTVPYVHNDGAPLQILSQLLTHKHLHHEIREKGGAYGGGAFHNSLGGIFGFYSYRDPNIPNTLDVIAGSGKLAVDREWTDKDLQEAKLSVFQDIDAPKSVSEEGMVYFLNGIDDEMRQSRRIQLLDVTSSDIQRVAQKYLINQLKEGQTATAVLGEKKTWVDDSWNSFPLSLEGTSHESLEAKDDKVTL